MNTLRLSLRLRKEDRGDHIALWSEDFGFFTYGDTLAEAEADIERGAAVLVNSFGEDLNALKEFLDEKRVAYAFSIDGGEDTSTILQELEVPIGSAV